METVMSICVGIGLSAACGFRVFVPLLVMSIASLSGHLTLAHGFEWIGSYPALISFSVATCIEIAGYYIPWVDHLLDTMATPAAIVAGTLVTASMVAHMSPFLKWTLAAIAGGGAAGLIQGTTVLTRGASTLTTGGFANPMFATIELGGALFTSVLAIVAPLLAVTLLCGLLIIAGRKLFRSRRKPEPQIPESSFSACDPGEGKDYKPHPTM
jgi:hypothetical protein